MGLFRGRKISLSGPRSIVCDFLHASRQLALLPVERRMSLASVALARQALDPRPSWNALFIKAYALVAARKPQLRRVYLSYPWPHLYEHPCNVVAVTFDRSIEGEDGVLLGLLRQPEDKSLLEIDAWLRQCRQRPLQQVGPFRRALRMSRLPLPLRRFLWWLLVRWSGSQRARFLGTFGFTTIAPLGAEALHLLSPWTTALHYGVLDKHQTMPVRLIFDHRVFDGVLVAKVLAELEEVLCTDIVAELRAFTSRAAA